MEEEKDGCNRTPSTGLNILLWNVRGLRKRRKVLLDLLKEKNIDIGLISNTRLKSNTQLTLEGYEAFRNNNPNSVCIGGTAIIIRRDIVQQFYELPSFSNENIQSTVIFYREKKIAIGVIYVLEAKDSHFVECLGILGLPFILGASFNSKQKQWTGGDSAKNEIDNLFNGRKLFPIIPKTSTYFSESKVARERTLDCFISNVNNKYEMEVPNTETLFNKPVLLIFQANDFLLAFNNSINEQNKKCKKEYKQEIVVKSENTINNYFKPLNETRPPPVSGEPEIIILSSDEESEKKEVAERDGPGSLPAKKAKTWHPPLAHPPLAQPPLAHPPLAPISGTKDSRENNNVNEPKPGCSRAFIRPPSPNGIKYELNPDFFDQETVMYQ